MSDSALEREFMFYAAAYGLELEEREYAFAESVGRKFRFDFAWPSHLTAVEIEGGVYSGGRHIRPKGFESDLAKMNLATELGWRVFRFSGNQLRSNPFRCLEQVQGAIDGKPGESLLLAVNSAPRA